MLETCKSLLMPSKSKINGELFRELIRILQDALCFAIASNAWVWEMICFQTTIMKLYGMLLGKNPQINQSNYFYSSEKSRLYRMNWCGYYFEMKLVRRLGSSRFGSPFFSFPIAILLMRKAMLTAIRRMVCIPSSSNTASPISAPCAIGQY